MSRVFDAYARYYDLLYRDKDYAAEAQYVASHICAHAPQAGRILELGCGTGAHAEHLARMGYTVHGVDLSPTMLARAAARKSALPPETAGRLSFGPGDVRTVRTGETYDAVISLFHVMSYQTADADLSAMFETTALHLRPAGLFLFDFWHGPAVLAQQPEVRTKHLEDDQIKVTRTATPVLHADQKVVDVNYHVRIEVKATGKIEEVRETHRMRYLFVPEVAHLAKPGLWAGVETCAWMGHQPPGVGDWSGFARATRR
jgi:SAM-dependent methyltransferase